MLTDEDGADCSIEDRRIAAFEARCVKTKLSLVTLFVRNLETSKSYVLQRFRAQIRLHVNQILEFRIHVAVCAIQARGKPPIGAGFQLSSVQGAKRSRRFRVKPINLTEVNLVV